MVLQAAPAKALSLALLVFLLPQCITEQLNAFDMRVFLTSLKGISVKVNKIESLLVNSNSELIAKFELTRKDLEDKLASANEEFVQFESRVLETVSSLQTSVSAAREDLSVNKLEWGKGLNKISAIESSINATRDGLDQNKRDLIDALATMSSIQTSLIATRDELALQKRDWDDGLAKMSFIEASVNATRNGMDENKRDLANVLATMTSIQSSINAARDELNGNKRDWDTAMASIHSIQSSVTATRDELASTKKDWNEAMGSISSVQSSVSATRNELVANKYDLENAMASISSVQSTVTATRDDLAANKQEWNNAISKIPSIESTLSATRTEVTELWRNVLSKKPRCRDGWYSFEDSCYFFSQAQLDWQSGRQRCQSMGSDYVKISSDNEFSFILNLINSPTWVGMNDIDVEGSFKWVSDNSPAAINRQWFHRNEPNNSGGNEDCIYFYHKEGKYMLNDSPCNVDNHKFICEMNPTVILAQ